MCWICNQPVSWAALLKSESFILAANLLVNWSQAYTIIVWAIGLQSTTNWIVRLRENGWMDIDLGSFDKYYGWFQ